MCVNFLHSSHQPESLQNKILNYIFQDKQCEKQHVHADIGGIDCQKRNDDPLRKSGSGKLWIYDM